MDIKTAVSVQRVVEDIPVEDATTPIIEALDQRRGVLLTSSYEYPGRYTRWDIGFVDPPLCLESRGRQFRFSALNDRGRVLLPALAEVIPGDLSPDSLCGVIATSSARFA